MKAAFFDFDGTLINGTSEHLFFKYLIKTKHINLIKSIAKFLVLQLVSLRFDPMFFREHKPYLKDISGGELKKYALEFYKKEIKKRIREDIIKKMINLKRQGYTIIIITSTLDILIEPFLKEYDIIHSFSSIYEPTSSLFRKDIKNIIPFGKNKEDYIMKFSKKYKVNLKNSYAFADSKSDKKMMRIIGNPVWV